MKCRSQRGSSVNPGDWAGEVCTCQRSAGPWEAAAAGRGRPGPAEPVVLGLGRSPDAGHRLQSGVDPGPPSARCRGGAGSERPPLAAQRTCQARRRAEPSPTAVSTCAGGARLTLVGGHLETLQVGAGWTQAVPGLGVWESGQGPACFGLWEGPGVDPSECRSAELRFQATRASLRF